MSRIGSGTSEPAVKPKEEIKKEVKGQQQNSTALKAAIPRAALVTSYSNLFSQVQSSVNRDAVDPTSQLPVNTTWVKSLSDCFDVDAIFNRFQEEKEKSPAESSSLITDLVALLPLWPEKAVPRVQKLLSLESKNYSGSDYAKFEEAIAGLWTLLRSGDDRIPSQIIPQLQNGVKNSDEISSMFCQLILLIMGEITDSGIALLLKQFRHDDFNYQDLLSAEYLHQKMLLKLLCLSVNKITSPQVTDILLNNIAARDHGMQTLIAETIVDLAVGDQNHMIAIVNQLTGFCKDSSFRIGINRGELFRNNKARIVLAKVYAKTFVKHPMESQAFVSLLDALFEDLRDPVRFKTDCFKSLMQLGLDLKDKPLLEFINYLKEHQEDPQLKVPIMEIFTQLEKADKFHPEKFEDKQDKNYKREHSTNIINLYCNLLSKATAHCLGDWQLSADDLRGDFLYASNFSGILLDEVAAPFLQQLELLINALLTKDIEADPSRSSGRWDAACQCLWSVVSQLGSPMVGQHTTLLSKILSLLLSKSGSKAWNNGPHLESLRDRHLFQRHWCQGLTDLAPLLPKDSEEQKTAISMLLDCQNIQSFPAAAKCLSAIVMTFSPQDRQIFVLALLKCLMGETPADPWSKLKEGCKITHNYFGHLLLAVVKADPDNQSELFYGTVLAYIKEKMQKKVKAGQDIFEDAQNFMTALAPVEEAIRKNLKEEKNSTIEDKVAIKGNEIGQAEHKVEIAITTSLNQVTPVKIHTAQALPNTLTVLNVAEVKNTSSDSPTNTAATTAAWVKDFEEKMQGHSTPALRDEFKAFIKDRVQTSGAITSQLMSEFVQWITIYSNMALTTATQTMLRNLSWDVKLESSEIIPNPISTRLPLMTSEEEQKQNSVVVDPLSQSTIANINGAERVETTQGTASMVNSQINSLPLRCRL